MKLKLTGKANKQLIGKLRLTIKMIRIDSVFDQTVTIYA